MSKKKKLDPGQIIMAAFNINACELADNERGILSADQRQRLRIRLIPWALCGVIALVLLVVSNTLTPPHDLIPYVMTGLLLFGIGFLAYVPRAVWILDATLNHKIQSVSGRVRQEIAGNANQMWVKYKLHIDDITFVVDKDTFLAFRNGDAYCLYYIPKTKTIVSAEWLNQSPFVSDEASSVSKLENKSGMPYSKSVDFSLKTERALLGDQIHEVDSTAINQEVEQESIEVQSTAKE